MHCHCHHHFHHCHRHHHHLSWTPPPQPPNKDAKPNDCTHFNVLHNFMSALYYLLQTHTRTNNLLIVNHDYITFSLASLDFVAQLMHLTSIFTGGHQLCRAPFFAQSFRPRIRMRSQKNVVFGTWTDTDIHGIQTKALP